MIHFITLYSQTFSKKEVRLKNIINGIYPQYIYHAIDLNEYYFGTRYTEENKFNYYSFKPELIYEYASSIKKGDIIIYIDTNDVPKPGLAEYIEKKLKDNRTDLLVSGTNYFHKRMQHPDTKLFFNNIFRYISSYTLQPEAGCIAFQNSGQLREKLLNWLQYTRYIAKLNHINPSPLSRHDQEALTYTLIQTSGNRKENWYIWKFLKFSGLRSYIDFEGNRHD